ncbi:hypothetical protein C8R44DRAFT_886172 [Mycena epipterygia]|nr:hypothetical protein C8R44DRAFT_886172 [Mycena epipterygia]
MSFALNGTHIDGGTFNTVAGNMTQVFNSHISHAGISAGTEQVEDTHALLPSTTGSISAIRADRASRHGSGLPYAITDRGHRHGYHQSELPYRHDNSTSGYIHASRTTIVPTQHHTMPLQDSSLFYPVANGYGRDVPEGHDNIPTLVDLVPAYSDNQGHIFDTVESQQPTRSVHRSIHTPPSFPETILGNTYNSIGGDMTQLSVTSYGESGIDILYRSVVTEALHDSVECFPEPACHPGTRTDIIHKLNSWSVDTSPESALLWLHGSAGMGKSAIAQMFAGECHKEGRLGASFFFRRGHPKRGTWHGLITTIAYQLVKSVPEFLLPLQQAMEADKLVGGRAIPVQFQRLLVEPFKDLSGLRSIPVIVLDGLDECADHTAQQHILRLFIGAIRDQGLPLRVLIISRPEPHLREVLQTQEILTICRPLVLSADKTAYHDIRTYLQDEFSTIHSEYMARGIDLGADWPTPSTLDELVQKSSGIFIYAATIIRFVSNEYSHPEDRLAAVLRLDPLSTAPLDDLYTEILSVLAREHQQLRILRTIWQSAVGGGHLSLHVDPEEIDMLLNLRRGTCRLVLRGLHSLFNVPPIPTRFSSRRTIQVLHASFSDYLGDPRRSGPWCVSLQWLQADYLHGLIRLLASPLPRQFASGDWLRTLYK